MPALLIAASLFAAPAMMPVASPVATQQDRWRGVNGNNVTRVFHTGGGSFEQLENGRWIEYGDQGTVIHDFEQERRDYNGVWLVDRARGGVRVQIDLGRGEIWGTPLYAQPRLLYRITDADSERRGRGWRGRRGGDGSGPGRRDDYNNNNGGYGRDDDRNGGWDRNGVRDVEVGPIWNQRDAENKCRAKAAELRADWTGAWYTTVPGRMSVCQMRRNNNGGGYGNNNGGGYGNNGGGYGNTVVREFEVGPLWNQRDADMKCRQKANELRGEWTGQWRTTVQGRQSVCEIRLRR